MDTPNRWHTIPRSSVIIFLVAVFLMFAGLGFANDVIDMGVQSPTRFALGVLLSGVFAASYAASGILLRGQFWKAFLPLFALHFLSNIWLANALPEPSRPNQMDALQTTRLKQRLVFDGLTIIATVCLGYAGLAYVSISEGKRHGRAQVEKGKLDAEMTAAREVQSVMVPEDLPKIGGYLIESVYRPAAEVGGDFFQVIPLQSGRALLIIGDVSGKGLRAAMIVSMIVGTLRTVTGFTEEPAQILNELNRLLHGRIQDGFATCLVARLNADGTLTVANAGHLSPYRNGSEIQLPGSLPLGLAEDIPYEHVSFAMAPKDSIVFLTDGVVEAQDDKRGLFGFAQVESLLLSGASAKDVAAKAQEYGQNDDITVLRVTRVV